MVFTFALPLALMAQGTSLPDMGGVLNPVVYFATLASFAGLIIPLSSVLIRLFGISNKFVRQLMSWIVAIALGLVGTLLNLGIFGGVEWYVALVYSIGAALQANGIFNITVVKALIEGLLDRFGLPKKEPALNKTRY